MLSGRSWGVGGGGQNGCPSLGMTNHLSSQYTKSYIVQLLPMSPLEGLVEYDCNTLGGGGGLLLLFH